MIGKIVLRKINLCEFLYYRSEQINVSFNCLCTSLSAYNKTMSER